MKIKIDKIIRSSRRTIGLEIQSDATLVIRAPRKVRLSEIDRVVNEKKSWIIEKKRMIQERMRLTAPKTYMEGEKLPYLGSFYEITYDDSKKVDFIDDKIVLPRGKDPQEQLTEWYREKTRYIVQNAAQDYARKLGISYKKIRITKAEKRWGSCSSRATLSFSYKLAMLPWQAIAYIVVHELMHLIELNHSPRFWNLVQKAMPAYKEQRSWLRKYGHLYYI